MSSKWYSISTNQQKGKYPSPGILVFELFTWSLDFVLEHDKNASLMYMIFFTRLWCVPSASHALSNLWSIKPEWRSSYKIYLKCPHSPTIQPVKCSSRYDHEMGVITDCILVFQFATRVCIDWCWRHHIRGWSIQWLWGISGGDF